MVAEVAGRFPTGGICLLAPGDRRLNFSKANIFGRPGNTFCASDELGPEIGSIWEMVADLGKTSTDRPIWSDFGQFCDGFGWRPRPMPDRLRLVLNEAGQSRPTCQLRGQPSVSFLISGLSLSSRRLNLCPDQKCAPKRFFLHAVRPPS